MSTTWFADWGAAGWSEDAREARSYAETIVATVADARAWSDTWRAAAAEVVDQAGGGFWDWLGGQTAAEFWTALYEDWPADDDAPEGWGELGDTWASAVSAAASTAEGREAGELGTVASGGTAATVEDLSDSSTWWPWLVAGAVILGLAAAARR